MGFERETPLTMTVPSTILAKLFRQVVAARTSARQLIFRVPGAHHLETIALV